MNAGDRDEAGVTSAPWAALPFDIVSAIAVVVANLSGLAIGDDGVGYRAIADSLAAGNGFGYFLERPVTIWPPGWPTLMAIVDRLTPLDTRGAAIVLNALTAAAIVVLTHRLTRRLVRDPMLVNAVTAVTAVGASTMVFGHLLMTDLAFAAVTLALFLTLLNARGHNGVGWLAGAAALVGAAFMVRYAGVVHIVTGGVWLAVDSRRPMGKRFIRAAAFGVAAAVVPVAWMLRNHSVDGTALGVRYSSSRGLIGNLLDLVATIGNFLVPGVEIETRTWWAVVGVLGTGVVAVLAWVVLRTGERFAPGRRLALLGTPAGLLVCHVAIYASYMLYARTTTGLNRLDFRLLNPLYLPLAIGAAAIIDRIPEATSDPRWSRAGRGLVSAWVVVNLAVGIGMVGYFATGPDLFVGNYEREEFVDVRASTALAAVPAECRDRPDRLSSNLPNALYPALEAQWSARITGLESNDPVDDLARLRRAVEAGEPRCLVWIDLEPTYGHLATLAKLSSEVALVTLAVNGPVAVYRLDASG